MPCYVLLGSNNQGDAIDAAAYAANLSRIYGVFAIQFTLDRRIAESRNKAVLHSTYRGGKMEQDWRRIDEENERLFQQQTEEAKKSSAADRSFFTAGQQAHHSVKENGLLPRRNADGEFEYDLQQGLKAACHGREDVVAVLILQRDLLARLDRNHKLLLAALVLLVYIAYRLT